MAFPAFQLRGSLKRNNDCGCASPCPCSAAVDADSRRRVPGMSGDVDDTAVTHRAPYTRCDKMQLDGVSLLCG